MATQVSLGDRLYTFPSPGLGELSDHTCLYTRGDWDSLRQELARVGYVRIRGLHDREMVLKARRGKAIVSGAVL